MLNIKILDLLTPRLLNFACLSFLMNGGVVARQYVYEPNLIKNERSGILRRRVEKLARKTLISENTVTLKIELTADKFFLIA